MHRSFAASVASRPLFVSLSCLVFKEWKTGKSIAFTWKGNVLCYLSQEMYSLEGIPVGWVDCSWHDCVNKGPSKVLNCTAAPSPCPATSPSFATFLNLLPGEVFQWLWAETSMNIRPQANLSKFLGELVLFSRWIVKRTGCLCSSLCVFSHETEISPADECDKVDCWAVCWESAQMPPNWALQLTCCYPGKVRLWLSATLFPPSFLPPPLSFLPI